MSSDAITEKSLQITEDSGYMHHYGSNWKTKTLSGVVVNFEMKRTYNGRLVDINLEMVT